MQSTQPPNKNRAKIRAIGGSAWVCNWQLEAKPFVNFVQISYINVTEDPTQASESLSTARE